MAEIAGEEDNWRNIATKDEDNIPCQYKWNADVHYVEHDCWNMHHVCSQL